jgi:ethanolamine utilization protein EutQ
MLRGPAERKRRMNGPRVTPVVYRAIEDSEVVYVSYPHWYDATVRSPHAARLEEFVEE